jgi:UPF0716 protein FxsA
MPLLILFIIVPLIEIGLFITVGGQIGLWPTLAIVVLTAILGTWMLREQGLRELSRLRSSIEQMRDPTDSLANGAMILFAGALLLTPGFFTDAIGFLLLIPAFRVVVMRYFRSRVSVQGFATHQSAPSYQQYTRPESDIIDGEYTEVDDTDTLPSSSGWTRH